MIMWACNYCQDFYLDEYINDMSECPVCGAEVQLVDMEME
jgi:rubrerythrin